MSKTNGKKLGWTQTDLGAKIGINSGAISKIEHGRKQLSVAKLSVLAEIFGVELGKVKELYFGKKFAREVYKHECPETVFAIAEATVKYLKSKNTRQSKINFGVGDGI